jgi:hypothetical protein
MNAGDDDFPKSGVGKKLDILDNELRRSRALRTSGKWDNAISASPAATVLDFDKRS